MKFLFGLAVLLVTSAACLGQTPIEVTTVTLSGQVTEISATDLSSVDDSAAFQSILPFSVGDTITSTVTWRTSVSESSAQFRRFDTDGFFEIVFGGGAASISTPVFGENQRQFQIAAANDGLSSVDNDQLSFRAIPFDDFTTVPAILSQGWTITRPGLSNLFFDVDLEARPEFFPSTSTSIPLGPLDINDFFSASLNVTENDNSISNVTASSTWTFDGNSHTGRNHTILGDFNELTFETRLIGVPEPSSMALLLALGMCGMARRKR